MIINENGYNKIQLNETINLSPDGKILSRSIMINLRNESPAEVWETYQLLKKLMDSKEDKSEKKIKNIKKETQKTKKENEDKKEEKKNNPDLCPKCNAPLIHRSGISKNGVAYNFEGCSSFPLCTYTRNTQDKKEVPADEDLMLIEG